MKVNNDFEMVCCNGCCLSSIIYQNEKLNVEYLIEDGMIVEKRYKDKIITCDKYKLRELMNKNYLLF